MIGRRYADHMPTYFRFGVGPFRFSQRLGRTQAQKRAAAKARGQRQSARQEVQYAQQEAQRHADYEKRKFEQVPAHDVTHGDDGSVSFILDPPGKPSLHVKLENGRFPAGWASKISPACGKAIAFTERSRTTTAASTACGSAWRTVSGTPSSAGRKISSSSRMAAARSGSCSRWTRNVSGIRKAVSR